MKNGVIVNSDLTSKRYKGTNADLYDQQRQHKKLWIDEIETVKEYLTKVSLSSSHETIFLDIPLGTGRFLELYKLYNVKIIGIDVSNDMMKYAKEKDENVDARVGDILSIDLDDKSVHVSICVRLLNLINEKEFIKAFGELNRVTRHEMIISLRLAHKYSQIGNKSVNHSYDVFEHILNETGRTVIEKKVLTEKNYALMLIR